MTNIKKNNKVKKTSSIPKDRKVIVISKVLSKEKK